MNIAVVRSIFGSIIFKIASSVATFISVPLLLHALGTDNYGIWVTLTALVGWLNLFDFGSGYSLKNKVTESLVHKDEQQLNVLIAGTIQFYLLSTLVILLVFAGALIFIDAFNSHLLLAVTIYLPVILAFPFTLGHFVIQGLKKFNLFNSLLLMQSVVWLLIIELFNHNIIQGSIERIAIVYSSLYVIVNFFIFFSSLRAVKFEWSEMMRFSNFVASKKSLLVGGNFFLLQVSSLLLFSLGNIMTYNNLQLRDVAQFDTVNKVYLMGMTVFNVVISVFWAEISHAKALEDKSKLLKIQKQLLLVAFIFSLGTVLVTFLVPLFVTYWTKGVIHVELIQLIPFVLLTSVQFFSYVGAVFLNAFEELKGQVVLSVIAAVLIIPLAKYFFYLNLGIGSVPAASFVLIVPTLLYVHFKSLKCIKSMNSI